MGLFLQPRIEYLVANKLTYCKVLLPFGNVSEKLNHLFVCESKPSNST